MKAAGLKVISEGSVAVLIPLNFNGALAADPSDFFLTPFAPGDGCAPGPTRSGPLRNGYRRWMTFSFVRGPVLEFLRGGELSVC